MSLANNVVSENGEQFIPASQRPDGTWRKARRVKEGYVPQEEVPLYESKGKQFMSRKNDPVILATGQVAKKATIPGLYIVDDDAGEKKKKPKKKIEDIEKLLNNVKIADSPKKKDAKSIDKETKSESTDPEKKLKNLKKRLREVESLEEKIKNGTLAKPEPEQLVKVKRKNELIVQIHELEKQLQ